ncbi:MAG: hypothetical protein J1E43_07140 [Christensenellaceae bacterium]|nr:hypothetical protein [Christensenellaceae bacterium]
MLTALRKDVQAVLERTPTARRPALRRSDDPDALLATDLPLTADDQAVAEFIARMNALGWHVWRQGGWLLMDAEVPLPDCAGTEPPEGEAGCCISLLLRHPEGEADRRAIRAVVKAAESGPSALERLCAGLHETWAAALREHRKLPGGLLPYLCRAVDMTKR